MSSPAEDGLFMPADWAPHAACWMAWPCRVARWRDHLVDAWRSTARLARTIAAHEPVNMLVRPEHRAEAMLLCGRGIQMHELGLDDSWIRDTGPTFLTDANDGVAGVAWPFNGWGNRWTPHGGDERVAGAVLASQKMHAYRGPVVLEGGAVSVDGTGTLLASEPCLLNPNRNPTHDRREVEEMLALFLGARRIVWLGESFHHDRVDGLHDLACFAGPSTVLVSAPGDDELLADTLARLKQARGAFGRSLDIFELPRPKQQPGGARRSYTNLYVANGAVILPAFDDPADARAQEILGQVFPRREIVPFDASALLIGNGGIRRATCPQPAGRALA